VALVVSRIGMDSALAQITHERGSQAVRHVRPTRWFQQNWCVYLALVVAVVVLYNPVQHYSFVGYDDPDYVTDNPHVLGGLSWPAVEWAFTTNWAANWIPLTWLSHMLICSLFGLQAGAHHLANVFFHLLSSLLLFAALKRMTAAHWRSALVAFLFAVHPLHVESVAWVTERKDVLSGVFWFLALWLYALYAERRSIRLYLMVLAAFVFGLMAKPMVVTLPFVLLLLDVWPLGRFRTAPLPAVSRRAILLEKIPFLVLAVGASAVTYLVQLHGGAVSRFARVPLSMRFENALLSYVIYVAKTFWPTRLAVFYPLTAVPMRLSVAAGVVLLAVSAAVLRWVRVRPYLAVGWFWFLGALVPAIGLVQVGAQARADRYTYLPMVGIFIAIAWGMGEIVARKPGWMRAVCALAAGSCLVFSLQARLQVEFWRDTETLFRHALEVTDGNYVAYNSLGLALRKQGQLEEAIANYRKALSIWPGFPEALTNLGEAYVSQKRFSEAVLPLDEAVRLNPDSAEARTNLANALTGRGDMVAAETQYREALRLQPDSANAHAGLATALANQHREGEALREYQDAIRLRPDSPDIHFNFAQMLVASGRTDEALGEFAETVRLKPDDAEAHRGFGVALAAQGRLTKALEEFEACVRLTPNDSKYRFNLATALAYLERNDEAIAQLSEAIRIQPDFTEALEARKYLLELRGSRH
jgi:tetratricopeptide (TPR) repeat protein